jgi:hypothetical protein
MKTNDEWVPVKSEAELRPGMLLLLKQCGGCSSRHIFILTAVVDAEGFDVGGMRHEVPTRSWRTQPPACTSRPYTFEFAIPQRRLFRHQDNTQQEQHTATRRKKENVE